MPGAATLDFEPVDHAVYLGRERLGRYLQTAPQRFAAFDAGDRLLGNFKTQKEACEAIAIVRDARPIDG